MSQGLALVLGLGEIGAPIYEMLRAAYGPEIISAYDPNHPQTSEIMEALFAKESAGTTFQFLHICFPETPSFLKDLSEYILKFKPRFVVIHSTVSVGMTSHLQTRLGEFDDEDNQHRYVNFFYSPVRGNISDGMPWCLKTYTKYLAGYDSPLGSTHNVKEHLAGAGFKVKTVSALSSLEKAKLWDLAWYGLNIAFYQELERDCYPIEYDVVRDFIESTPVESEGKVQRSVFYGGHIGGHCVMQAIEKILAVKEIPMLRAIIESNQRRLREVTFDPLCVLGKS